MAHRNNHLAMGKIEPLDGCQGFKCKSMLTSSACLVVPPPPTLTSLILQLKLSCQQWGESCTSPKADNFLPHLGLSGPSAWANCPLAGHSDPQFIRCETDGAAVIDSRTRNFPFPSQEDQRGKSRVTYMIFHNQLLAGLVQPSDPIMTRC